MFLRNKRFRLTDVKDGLSSTLFVGERFGIAEDGRERRSQLMARVGHEIDAHFFSGHGTGAVDQTHQRGVAADLPDDQSPRAADLRDSGDVDLRGTVREYALQRLRMTNCEAYVTPFDARPEKPLSPFVRSPHDPALDDQRGLVQRIDQGALG